MSDGYLEVMKRVLNDEEVEEQSRQVSLGVRRLYELKKQTLSQAERAKGRLQTDSPET